MGKKVVGPEKKVVSPEKKVVDPKQNVSAYLPFPFWNACFPFSDAFSNVRRAHHEDLKAVDIDRSVYKYKPSVDGTVQLHAPYSIQLFGRYNLIDS